MVALENNEGTTGVIETGLLIAGVYLGLGLLVSILFLVFGVAKADAAAQGAGIYFKLIILPGLVLLWPIILGRWLSGHQINKDIHAGDRS